MSTYQEGELLQGRYRILKELGQGGSGTTYAAEDLKQQSKTVAIKVLLLQDLDDWKVLELFEREAKVLSQLSHPGIPRYLDYFQIETEDNHAFHIVQERAQGKSLSTWIEEGWRCDEATLRLLAKQVLDILIYLKTFNPPVIHRDIKPQNIIRRNDGKIFLVDFGAVRDTYYSTLMRGSTIVGTYGYMAPEQFQGHASPGTDLYGLGATLLFLLTKRPPSELPHHGLRITFRDWVTVSPHFADWLETLLEPDISDRVTSAQEALKTLLQPPSAVKSHASLPPWTALLGGVFAVLLAIGLGNTYKWRILGSMGVKPPTLCAKNSPTLKNYLNQGGDPNTVVKKRIKFSPAGMGNVGDRVPLLLCVSSTEARHRLLQHGANPNQRLGGINILHYAVATDQRELAQQLIEHGASINFAVNVYEGTTTYQQSLLHLAVEGGDFEIVKALVDNGAKINARDNRYGSTPLDVARRLYKVEIGKFLDSHGAVAEKYEARW